MDQYEAITKAELEVASGEVELEKAHEELQAKARSLESSLPLLENSVKLYGKSVENKKRLLEIAKVNYKNGRLSTEEYLRYEDDVIDAEAKRYKAQAEKWQTLMQLAVIYANNIEEIVQ
jgi:outer membrane protein TolC